MEQKIESRCGGLVEVFSFDPGESWAQRAKEFQKEYNPGKGLKPTAIFFDHPKQSGQRSERSIRRPGDGRTFDLSRVSVEPFASNPKFELMQNDPTVSEDEDINEDHAVRRSKKRQIHMIHETAKQFFIKGDGFKRLDAFITEDQEIKMLRAFDSSLSQHHFSSDHDYLAGSCAHHLMLPELRRCAEIVRSGKIIASEDHLRFPLAGYAANLFQTRW